MCFTLVSAFQESNAYLGILFSKISVYLSIDELLKQIHIQLYSSQFYRIAVSALASVMLLEEFTNIHHE